MTKELAVSHMDVPGHDNKFGYGGACFPKDTLAFLKYFKKNNLDFEILESAIRKNNLLRSKYKVKDNREIEQNISYNDELL